VLKTEEPFIYLFLLYGKGIFLYGIELAVWMENYVLIPREENTIPWI
jgi:hypothetical protein